MKIFACKALSSSLILSALALELSAPRPARAQSFTLDLPLQVPRWSHTATLLTNGQVLIAGGKIANDFGASQFANTNECELYDPATGVSTPTADMTDSHTSAAATLLTNGLVLIAGGENNGFATINSAELYNTGSGTWTNTGALQHKREVFALAQLPNGKVLVAGGYDNSLGQDISSAEFYDPNTGVWTNAASMSFGADSQTATVLADGTVLVAGGSFNGNPLTNAVLYNPANNTWTNTGPLNEARGGHTATLLTNGQVLVVGGGGNTAEIYNPTNHTWTLVAPMNEGRYIPSATLLPNGQVLVLGGNPGQTGAELYDSGSNNWTYTGSLNVGRIFHTATLAAGGQVVVTGGDAGTIGYFNGPPLADVETYNQLFSPLALALNATNLAWTTSGDTNWFVEPTNTFDGIVAAQSGSVTNGETTTLSATVTGPGVVTFYWSSMASDPNQGFDLEFWMDDPGANDLGDLTGDNAWVFAGPFTIPAGEHTLNWTVSANGDTDPTQAGFVDEVKFISTAPVIAPIGWWKGDSNALDSAGTNHGTLHSNVTFAPGELNQAFNFDGAGGYVELPNVSSLLPDGTISLWVNLRNWNWQADPNGTYIWAGTQYLPENGSWDGINLGNHPGFTSTGEFMFGIFDGNWSWAHSGIVPQTNTWYHVAGTWGSGGLQIYINGQLAGTNSYTGPAPSYTVYNLIGRSSWNSSQINGLVDDVRLYNRALGASEISALANPVGNPTLLLSPLGTNVVLSWPLAASTFTLESTASLSSPSWAPATNTVFWTSNNLIVTNAISDPMRFFRLRQ